MQEPALHCPRLHSLRTIESRQSHRLRVDDAGAEGGMDAVESLVCLEWDEVESYDRWWSIVAVGRYEELSDAQATRNERLRAYSLLSKYLMWWQPGAASYVANLEEHATPPYNPIYYRILIDQITGRRAVPDSREAGSS